MTEENWAVGYIKDTLTNSDICKVDINLLYCERITIADLQKLCVDNYWYIDPLSDGYITFTLHKDYLRQDSCVRKVCGLTAQEAVEQKIDQRREAIYKSQSACVDVHRQTSLLDLPKIRTYRIQWLTRPLHIIYDDKQQHIPIWHLV